MLLEIVRVSFFFVVVVIKEAKAKYDFPFVDKKPQQHIEVLVLSEVRY